MGPFAVSALSARRRVVARNVIFSCDLAAHDLFILREGLQHDVEALLAGAVK
jgi:hypothetical protein